jgi:histidyl-tRNA synthetase
MPVTNISGFQELLPNEQLAFDKLISIIKNNFESYGFVPLDTCVVEKTSTLLSKGNDNEIYGIYRLAGEEGTNKKDMGLRFDLTVPLARYVAQNYAHLTFPYRRYHIAPVWRGERPQAGRYRQFYQCDIDIIGENELSKLHDSELISVILKIFKDLKLPNFTIKINNRNLLVGLIKSFGIENNNIANIIKLIDKADKISRKQLETELQGYSLSDVNIALIVEMLDKKFSNHEWITFLKDLNITNEEFVSGLSDLEKFLSSCIDFDVDLSLLQIDPTLARGLNYYTGIVYETKMNDYPELGSICGGGRYANLAGSFTNKNLPGVGISIGISRLFPKLMEIGLVEATRYSTADVMVTTQNADSMSKYLKLAEDLRQSGVKVEVYLENKPLAAQLKYAAKKGFEFVIIANTEELEGGYAILKNMQIGTQETMNIASIHSHFEKVLLRNFL